MGWQEKKLINKYLQSMPKNERMFRINAGMGWTAAPKNKIRISKKQNITLLPGDMVLRQAQPFYGAPTGWADLAGWETVTVTDEMVGQQVAIFKFVEVKATGDLSPAQKKFKSIIEKMGGIFIKLTSKEQ